MCGFRREDLDDKIRCSFRSLVGEKTAPSPRKEGQVRLENIDVSQNHIKRRIVEDPNRLCFEIFHYLKLDSAGNVVVETIGCRGHEKVSLDQLIPRAGLR